MLDDPQCAIALSEMNFGQMEAANRLTRLDARFYGDKSRNSELRMHIGNALGPREAAELGLVTFTPDELDWSDEIRLAIESRRRTLPRPDDRFRGKSPLWRAREHGVSDIRTAFGMAELDLHSPQCGGTHGSP